MTQTRSFSFHDPETSRRHNNRFARIIQDGVYTGYIPVMAPGSTKDINVTLGFDDLGRAITKEGVIVFEDQDVFNAVTVSQPDAVNPRWDLLVLEYQYTTNLSQVAVYKLVKGIPAADPEKPVPENDFQVSLAYVYVRPDTSGSSPRQPNVTNDDLFPAQRASQVNTSSEVGDLSPSIAPGSLKLFFNSGKFSSADGSEVLSFDGGYTDEIDGSILSDQYYVYGITDDVEIVLISQVSDLSLLPPFQPTALPLAIAHTLNGIITDIIDLRVIFYRPAFANQEEDFWLDHFGNSIFQYAVLELFSSLDGLENTGVYTGSPADYTETNADSDFEITLDAVSTDLVITYNGAGASAEASIIIGDVLLNSGFTTPQHMQILGVTDIAGLSYDIATANAITPGAYFGISQPIVPLTAASPIQFETLPSTLYIRLILPAGTFSGAGETKRISSLAYFFNVDSAVGSDVSFVADSIANAITTANNLVANPFVLWSQNNPTTKAAQIPHTYLSDLELVVTAPGDMGPDGWYLLEDHSGNSLTLRRPALIGAPPEDSRSFVEAVAASGGVFNLEHRIPFTADMFGHKLTFSLNCQTSVSSANVTLSIYGYSRDASGNLEATNLGSGTPYFGAESRRFVVTNTGLGNQYVQLGFRATLTYPGGGATIAISQPMASVGEYSSGLPYNPPANMADATAGYYERVHMVKSGSAEKATVITESFPLRRKFTELGPITAREVANGKGASISNLGAVSVAASFNHIEVQAKTSNVGAYSLDGEFEAFIVPEIV